MIPCMKYGHFPLLPPRFSFSLYSINQLKIHTIIWEEIQHDMLPENHYLDAVHVAIGTISAYISKSPFGMMDSTV